MSTLRSCSGPRQSGKRRKIQALVWVLLCACVLRGVAGECPKVCECKWKDGKETVTCIGAEFIDIPRQLDPSTQVLDLQHNNLQVLSRDAFVDTGLVNLQKLWLSHCKIKHMERGAFNMLDNLVELDLSHNLLRVVPTAALIDISGLRELSLANNDLATIPADAFAPTPDLVHLDLSSNRIRGINPKAFRCLATLEILKLSSNLLVYLMQDLLVPLKALHGLNLNDNPWTCDCRLRPLRQWMLDHKITSVSPPTCARPKRLNGVSWELLELDEFVCEPHVFAETPSVEADDDDNVSLVCRATSDVEVNISWLFKQRPLEPIRKSRRYRIIKHLVANQSAIMSNLTIRRVEPRDQGTYTCVAENKAGRSEANLTLHVAREEAEESLVYMDKKYMTGSLLSGLGVLVTILLLVSCVVHRRQRVRRFRRQEEDREMRGVNACAVAPTATTNATAPAPAPVAPRPSATQQRKPSDYLVIPSGGEPDAPPLIPLQRDDAWLQPEAINGGYTRSAYLENGRYDNSSLERYREDIMEDLRGHQRSPSTISYVELPSTELPRRQSALTDKESLMNLEFETDILRRECSPTGSLVSVVSNGQLEDLLGLPYPAPRRDATKTFHHPDMNNIARKHRPYLYDDRRRDRLPYDPTSLNARCYSALNLAMSEAATHAFFYPRGRRPATRYPSLPSTPMLAKDDNAITRNHDARRLRRLMSANRGVYRSLEGAGDLANSFLYQYPTVQLESYPKDYRSVQKRLSRRMDKRDSLTRAGGSASRLTDDLRGSGALLGSRGPAPPALTRGRLSRASSLTPDVTGALSRDLTDSITRSVTGRLSRSGSLTRDITGGLTRDVTLTRDLTGSLTRDVTSSLARDVTSTLARDVTSSLARDVTTSLARDIASSLSRDVAESLKHEVGGGVDLFSDASPSSPYLDMELGLARGRPRAATEPLLEVARSGVLGHRKPSLALGRAETMREAMTGRVLSPSDSMIDAMQSRAEGVREAVVTSHKPDPMIEVTPAEPSRPTEPLRSILKNRYEGGGLLYKGEYTNSAYYDDEDDADGALSQAPYSPSEYKDYLDHGS